MPEDSNIGRKFLKCSRSPDPVLRRYTLYANQSGYVPRQPHLWQDQKVRVPTRRRNFQRLTTYFSIGKDFYKQGDAKEGPSIK